MEKKGGNRVRKALAFGGTEFYMYIYNSCYNRGMFNFYDKRQSCTEAGKKADMHT